MKDPTLQHIFGLSGGPDGTGDDAAPPPSSGQSERAPSQTPNRPINPPPGHGLEHTPLYTRRRAMGFSEGGTLSMLAGIALNAGCGVAVGVALAPEQSKRTKYGAIGGVLGALFGSVGMAGQALYVVFKE